MKSVPVFALAGAVVLAAILPLTATAQNAPGGVWRLPQRAAGRTATSRPAPPPPVVAPSLISPLLPLTYRVPVAIFPAILMSDGSIFANFGFGYEPVVRVCGGARMGAVVGSNGVVLQPAPAMTSATSSQVIGSRVTYSQLSMTGLPIHQVIVSDVARLACFAGYGSNVVYVYR